MDRVHWCLKMTAGVEEAVVAAPVVDFTVCMISLLFFLPLEVGAGIKWLGKDDAVGRRGELELEAAKASVVAAFSVVVCGDKEEEDDDVDDSLSASDGDDGLLLLLLLIF